MALCATDRKLPLSIFFFCLLWPCSYGVSPTISHANEPFILPFHFPTCIYTTFHSFIHTIPPHASYKVGSLLEKEAICEAPINDTTAPPSSSIALHLRLLDSKLNSSKEVSGEALQRGFGSLLEEFRRTLKLRYKWAVIMSGHYWVEYQSKMSAGVGRRGSKSSPLKFENARGGGGAERKKGAGSRDGADMECLGRGDVLVSHNKKLGGSSTDINGADLDVLAAQHAIVAQNDEFYLMMQGDCNLVLYTAGGYPLWSSRSKGKGKGSKCSLSLLADGNLVITNEKKKRVWESGSSIAASCPSVFILIMQSDGNLVIYDMLSGLPIWATGTNPNQECGPTIITTRQEQPSTTPADGPCYKCGGNHWAKNCSCTEMIGYCLECSITHVIPNCPKHPNKEGKTTMNVVGMLPSPSGLEAEPKVLVKVVTRAQAKENAKDHADEEKDHQPRQGETPSVSVRTGRKSWKAKRDKIKA
ncbi:hypothetical protein L7F22_065205 [Adiantum nelumboides]|nr:hypothetical protein [Adiantum nelumboides]